MQRGVQTNLTAKNASYLSNQANLVAKMRGICSYAEWQFVLVVVLAMCQYRARCSVSGSVLLDGVTFGSLASKVM